MNPSPKTTGEQAGWVDVLGIGFGPANIALAIAAEELGSPLNLRFLEQNAGPGWQEGMLLPDSDIQNHPLRDLVTPRNPRSRYTFTNFLFEQGRLYEHLNLPTSFPLRLEYREYVVWVAQHFAHLVDYGCRVTSVQPMYDGQGRIQGYEVSDSAGRCQYARSVVFAPGRTPNIPEPFAGLRDDRVVHLTDFAAALESVKARVAQPRVAIVGGSQTAVELLLHVNAALPPGSVTTGITRNFGFRLKDTSPFSGEVYFPAFVDAFYKASDEDKARLRKELVFTNYSAADRDVIDALYVKLYQNRLLGKTDLQVRTLTAVEHVKPGPGGIKLGLRQTLENVSGPAEFDLVVLATGFKDLGRGPGQEAYPALMKGVAEILDLDGGMLKIGPDYGVALRQSGLGHAPVFLNGLCESSHGMGDAGSFSLLSLRSAAILGALQHGLLPDSSPAASPAQTVSPQRDVSLQPVSK